MTIFDFLNMIGGLCLFLFGMNLMGQALERRAGSKLRTLLAKMTDRKWAGLLTGLGITAVIQSSSATTVMVVGFVNSGLMTLKQSINVIMGANIGTTVTAWLLSLAGIDSGNIFIKLLKPSSFTPVLALIGIILYMFGKSDRKKDVGLILLSFATLMYGMETMSSSVSGLKNVPEFRQIFLMFSNPILGVLAGAILTGIIQSSSASVGILQALASTGRVSYGAAIPIIMGQNIGTCVTAMISSVGANKNAKRAALVHLSFNIIGTAVWLTVFCIVKAIFAPAILNQPASLLGIAVSHSLFNVLCTVLLVPMSDVLEKIVCRIIPDGKKPQEETELDIRLLATPAIALERCSDLMNTMAKTSLLALTGSLTAIFDGEKNAIDEIKRRENKTDHYEDLIGTYLVKLSAQKINENDSMTAAEYLRLISDFERIADHSVNIINSVTELREKELEFSPQAKNELVILTGAVEEICNLAFTSFINSDIKTAEKVEPLKQVICDAKEEIRAKHILRLQKGECSIETGFVLVDLLTNLERVSDHCSNIAACVMDTRQHNLNLHESVSNYRKHNEEYEQNLKVFEKKYAVIG